MRTQKLFIVLTLLCMSCLTFNGSADAQESNEVSIQKGYWNGKLVEYVADEVLVKLKPGYEVSDITDFLSESQAEFVGDLNATRWGLVKISDGQDIFRFIQKAKNSLVIARAEPNFVVYLCLKSNDPDSTKQWVLHNKGLWGGTVGADINIRKPWDITMGSQSVLVGVVDSGIPLNAQGELSHPDLNDVNRYIIGPNIGAPGSPINDTEGHGTHVTGIIGAETNNATGVAGVDWNCRILAIKVTELEFFTLYLANGIIYAADHGTKLINVSAGQEADSSNCLRDAVDYAASKGSLICACAGNIYVDPKTGEEYTDVMCPASFTSTKSNVISVAATTNKDERADYSRYGPGIGKVTVAAPGGHPSAVYYDATKIWSTYPTSLNPNGYAYTYGTSMATAFAFGLASLILSLNSSLSPSQMRLIIEQTADDVNSATYPRNDMYLGYGRINTYQALKYTLENYGGTLRGEVFLTEDLTIKSGATLTIQPGTTIKFAAGTRLTIKGTLTAEGTSFEPITFQAETGNWYGIVFENGSSGYLQCC